MRCQAIAITESGQRCMQGAVRTVDGFELCWTHAHAVADKTRGVAGEFQPHFLAGKKRKRAK